MRTLKIKKVLKKYVEQVSSTSEVESKPIEEEQRNALQKSSVVQNRDQQKKETNSA